MKVLDSNFLDSGIHTIVDSGFRTIVGSGFRPLLGLLTEKTQNSGIFISIRANSNGVYELEASGKVPVYCHMASLNGCGSGGWTLVMKIDGSKVRILLFHCNIFHPSNSNIVKK